MQHALQFATRGVGIFGVDVGTVVGTGLIVPSRLVPGTALVVSNSMVISFNGGITIPRGTSVVSTRNLCIKPNLISVRARTSNRECFCRSPGTYDSGLLGYNMASILPTLCCGLGGGRCIRTVSVVSGTITSNSFGGFTNCCVRNPCLGPSFNYSERGGP